MGEAVESVAALLEGFRGGVAAGGAESVAGGDLVEPAAQLRQVLVVFLQLPIGEVGGGGFLVDIGNEVLAAIDDFGVFVVACGVVGVDQVATAD